MQSGVFPQLPWPFWRFCVAFPTSVCRQPPRSLTLVSRFLVDLAATHPVQALFICRFKDCYLLCS